MLINFSVSNFRSFSEEKTISFVAKDRLANGHEDHAVQLPGLDQKVLRLGVIYGANGAGKSNLFKALRFVEGLITDPPKKDEPLRYQPFRFGDLGTSPSTFDIQFLSNNKIYRFGLKAKRTQIVEEWLMRIDGTREINLYQRTTDIHDNTKIDAPNLKNHSEKLEAVITLGAHLNQLFLASVFSTLDPEDAGEDLTNVLMWFSMNLRLITPESTLDNLGGHLSKDPEFLEFAGKFLKAASTGIDHLNLTRKKLSTKELKELLPAKDFSNIMEQLESEESVTIGAGNVEIAIGRTKENEYYTTVVKTEHSQEDGKKTLNLYDESDGTQRLLHLIPVLQPSQHASPVFFIDEIDRSMHPSLVWGYLDYFLKTCGNSQLIVTTHEANLLDLDLLRRDEVWFAEKDEAGSTDIFSMADFPVRTDHDIRNRYIQGRYGAIPFLGDLERILPKNKDK